MPSLDDVSAAADRGDYATAIQLARIRRGWSQSGLARRVHCHRSIISRLESGEATLPDLATVEMFAEALDVPPAVLGAARFGTTIPEGDEVRRRQMLITMGLVLAGIPMGSTSALGAPRRVQVVHAARVRAQTDAFRAVVYQQGASRAVRQDILNLLEYTTSLISHASEEQVRQHLLDALGDAAGLAAYAYRDLEGHQQAQEHYLLAINAARAAGDAPLVGHLLVRMAGHQIELKNPDLVFSYLQAARDIGRVFSPGELANQCAIAGWAQAITGSAQPVHRHIGVAEEHFANRATHASSGAYPERGWQVRHTAEAELFSLSGAAYSELARHDPRHAQEAIRRLSLALKLRGDTFARNATLDRISLAEAHLANHDLNEALVNGATALEQTQGSFSTRVRARLGGLADSLVAHQRRPDVRDLIARIDAVRGRRRPRSS